MITRRRKRFVILPLRDLIAEIQSKRWEWPWIPWEVGLIRSFIWLRNCRANVMRQTTETSMTGTPMKCPNCDGELVEKRRDGVEMEICPSCEGMWLSRQELAQLE